MTLPCAPASVAVAGASDTAGTVGHQIWRSLTAGYAGRLLAVNRHFGELTSAVVYGRVRDLPLVPELAIICVPASEAAGLVEDFGQLGTRQALVTAAGLDATQWQAVREAAARHALRLVYADGLDDLLAVCKAASAAAAKASVDDGVAEGAESDEDLEAAEPA